jgi:hypothetical protein
MSNEPTHCPCGVELVTMSAKAARKCHNCVAKERDQRRQREQSRVEELERIVEKQRETIDELQAASSEGWEQAKKHARGEIVRELEEKVEELSATNRDLTKRLNEERQSKKRTNAEWRKNYDRLEAEKIALMAKLERTLQRLERTEAGLRDEAGQVLALQEENADLRGHARFHRASGAIPDTLWERLFVFALGQVREVTLPEHMTEGLSVDQKNELAMRATVAAAARSADTLIRYLKERNKPDGIQRENHRSGPRDGEGEEADRSRATETAPHEARGASPATETSAPGGSVAAQGDGAERQRRRPGGQELDSQQEAPAGLPRKDGCEVAACEKFGTCTRPFTCNADLKDAAAYAKRTQE